MALMDEGERKEQSSLPPNYVSLAQLQERWLRKQDEKKLKQNQEEEEKRERDMQANNWNQRRGAKMAGEFLRYFDDKGKGKEIVSNGPENGGENEKRIEIFGGGRTMDFKRAEEDGVNELEKGETLLELGKKVENEIGHGKNWRGWGGERRRNKGYGERSNVLKEYRPVVLRAEDVVSMVCSERRSLSVGDSKGRNNVFEGECSNGDKNQLEIEKLDHEVLAKIGKSKGVMMKGGLRNGNQSRNFDQKRRQIRPKLSTEKEGEGSNGAILALEIEKKVDHEVLAGESAKIVGNGNRKMRNRKKRYARPKISTEEDKLEGEDSDGEEVVLGIEKKVDHEVLAGESAQIAGNGKAVKGSWKNKNRKRRYARAKLSTEEDRIEGESSDANKVVLEFEKKMQHEVLVGETAKLGENKWVRKGYQKNENQRKDFGQQRRYGKSEISAEVDRFEGECSNSNKVAPVIEKKMDDKPLVGETVKQGENKLVRRGYQKNENKREDFGQQSGNVRPEISAEEGRIEGEGSSGNRVAVEIEKKVDNEWYLAGKVGVNKGDVNGYPRNEEQRRGFCQEKRCTRPDISAMENRIEGECSNGNNVPQEIEKGVGENRGGVKGYQRNKKWSRDFGCGGRYTRYEMPRNRWKTNSVENGMVWVKKEEKLGA